MKLFVGGISFDTDNESLRRGFEGFGELEDVVVIHDRETGRSRGFGFVTFRERADAERAIQEMDGHELDGRTIRVNEATERAPRGGGPRPFGNSFGGGKPPGKGGKSRRGDRRDRW